MRYDAVIYDLDGTLLNTLDDLAAAVNHAMRAMGCPAHSVEDVRRMVGDGMEMLIRRALPQDRQDAVAETLALFKAHYAAHAQDITRPYEGIFSLLDELAAAGVRQAIVSNKGDPFVKELNRRYFGRRIAVAVGERPGVRRKPSPDMLVNVMREWNALPARTLYVGDSGTDVETARAAGVRCASVTWGFRTREELLASGASLLVDTPRELTDYVLGA